MTKPGTLRVLVTADAVGGVWQYSIDLARGLSRLGIETALAVMGPSPSETQLAAARQVDGLDLVDTGLPLDWLADEPASLRAAGEEIAALAIRSDTDLLQLNTPALAAETRFPLPVVAVQHSCVATWWEAVHGTPLPADFA